jgi:hypothetical protein
MNSSFAAVGLQVAEQSTQAAAAVAEMAMAQIQADRAGENAQNGGARPQAANPPGVGGLVDQTA